MIRVIRVLCFVVSLFLILVQPTLLRAQTASEHFVEVGGINADAGSAVAVDVKVQGCSDMISTGTINYPGPGGTTGENVARDVAEALCLDQVANGNPACTTALGGAIACAAAFPADPGAVTPVFCNCDGVAGNDFSITVLGIAVTVAPEGATPKVQALHCKTTGPNNGHGNDLLQRVLVRVTPGGTGNLDFTVSGAPGSGPNPFTVNTTGKTDLQLHDAICQGYAALGVTPFLHPATDNGLSAVPADFNGNFVEVFYPASVTQFEVKRQSGTSAQTITTETNGSAPTISNAVPTMSEWGMGALIVTLLLTGLWMLRRRQRMQST